MEKEIRILVTERDADNWDVQAVWPVEEVSPQWVQSGLAATVNALTDFLLQGSYETMKAFDGEGNEVAEIEKVGNEAEVRTD